MQENCLNSSEKSFGFSAAGGTFEIHGIRVSIRFLRTLVVQNPF